MLTRSTGHSTPRNLPRAPAWMLGEAIHSATVLVLRPVIVVSKCTFWQSKVVVWQITHQNSFVSWRRDPPCMSVWHEWETRHPQNTNRPDRRDDRWGSIAGSVADKASHIWRRMRQQTTAANHLGVSIFVFIGEPRYFRGISRTKRILRSFSSESSLQSISSKILLWKRNDSSVVLWT